MKSLNKISLKEVIKNRVLSSRVAKTQQSDAEGFIMFLESLGSIRRLTKKKIKQKAFIVNSFSRIFIELEVSTMNLMTFSDDDVTTLRLVKVTSNTAIT